MSQPPIPTVSIPLWRSALAGLCASLVGIGLARFAYTPLVPALIGAHWFAPSETVYLGAANLAGYLAGAVLARPIARRISSTSLLRAMMVLTTLAFFACATPFSILWFFVWRFASGLAGAFIMVLAAPHVMAQLPPRRRGLVSGIIFSGVGIGVVASGTLVPLLLRSGLVAAWCGLGALSAILTVIAWRGWPEDLTRVTASASAAPVRRAKWLSFIIIALMIEYGLNAFGLVPHMMFLVDFVARGLARGIDAGSGYWVIYGVGAIAGPLIAGRIADRIGFGVALRAALLLQALFVAIPLVTAEPISLAISSLVIGAFTPGVVTLVLGRAQELLPGNPDGQRSAWAAATTAFALCQAAAGYGFSFLFAWSGGSYHLLFGLAVAAFLLALILEIAVASLRRK